MQQKTIRPEPVIPDHEVLRKIGGGAYGEVWLARGVTGAMRAVKVVYREDFTDERTFEREFEGILKFEPISRDHPGLVHVLHVGRSEGEEEFYYYVMELGDDAHGDNEVNPVEYEPRTLRSDALKSDGKPLDTNFCIEAGRRLAEALQHLHERGLTHRDVKPSNIIFVDGKAKLADIGLVAAMDQRTFVGTEGFVPPEGPGSVGADVYSLGKVLYEMATGMDRLQFPELPPPDRTQDDDRKKWIRLNRIICEVCEPRLVKRKIKTSEELAAALTSLQEGKRRRREIDSGTKAVFALAAVLALIIFQAWLQQSWGTRVIEGKREPLPREFTSLVLQSKPPDAEVFDEEGNSLGFTKKNFDEPFEVGQELTFLLSKPGYLDTEIEITIENSESGFQIVSVPMQRDAPPKAGDLWEDALGMVYRPEGDHGNQHRSIRYVSAQEWEVFRNGADTDEAYNTEMVAHEVDVIQDGQPVRAVLVPKNWAEKYTEWLARLCRREGYLREISDATRESNREIIPRIDWKFDQSKLPPYPPQDEWRPFYCEVRIIPYAKFNITSTPPGASVYFDGVYVGRTPLEEIVPPGILNYSVFLEGYQQNEPGFIELLPFSTKEVAVELSPTKSVRFDREWKNSLGVRFVPMGDELDLMVAVWETRVKDFEAYEKESSAFVQRPRFAQGPDHPVVNVTREEARAFCDWLTEHEKNLKLLQEPHRYRLPTDEEWSQMAGLDEEGDSPAEREQNLGNEEIFPWGIGVWPPPNDVGNYSDQQIDGFEDGYLFTAPVGRFMTSPTRLSDLGGNVYEWVDDDYRVDDTAWGVARGASWDSHDPAHLALRHRDIQETGTRLPSHGFRVVLVKLSDEELAAEPEEAEVEEKGETSQETEDD